MKAPNAVKRPSNCRNSVARVLMNSTAAAALNCSIGSGGLYGVASRDGGTGGLTRQLRSTLSGAQCTASNPTRLDDNSNATMPRAISSRKTRRTVSKTSWETKKKTCTVFGMPSGTPVVQKSAKGLTSLFVLTRYPTAVAARNSNSNRKRKSIDGHKRVQHQQYSGFQRAVCVRCVWCPRPTRV